jgi:RNA polymerase sigma-70 factor (ECF subfamily)
MTGAGHTSLQYLPARQRAVLILRDVLAWPAADVAELTEPDHRALLDQYIAAFQNADAAALERLLRKDATLKAPPLRTWYAGPKFCMPYMATHVLGSPGHWRMLPTSANGQPAVAAYYRGSDGTYLPYGIVVLTATAEGISRITAFGDPALVTSFGFPAVPPADAE